jgi:endo-1,4-beta-xylanase
MKKLVSILLFWACVFAHGQNLNGNGGFENDLNQWFTQAADGTNATFSIVTDDVVEGTRALKVDVITPGANPWNVQAINDAWASETGKTYTLSFYAKATAAGSQFKVIQQNNTYAEQIISPTTSWQKYEWTFTAQEASLELKFHFPAAGTFLIDNISIPRLSTANDPIVFQAESGTIPASDPAIFAVLDEATTRFVRVQADVAASQNPGTDSRVITYSVTFPSAGTYELYARVRVGAGAFSDDSFFYGNGFGAKSVANADDWITVNGLSPVGHTAITDVVSGAGTASTNVWKWINLSKFGGGETPISFTVTASNLTQEFQIGSRENGLDIDKFVFGPAGVFFTVANLDNGQAGTIVPPPPPFTPTGPPLATGKSKFLGGVYSVPQRTNFTAYWNQVTPENSGKWGSVESVRDVMNWTELDEAYNLAKTNGFPFRFHVLIWGNQQPAWIENLPPAEQLEEIKEWFAAVAERYPDIDFIEVVNEPTNDPPNQAGNGGGNYLEALGGNGTTGWDWILTSFRLARQYFPPTTKLMLNDYNVENNPPNAQRYMTIINLLKAENLIDIVGMQGHAFSTRIPSADLKANLDFIASAGLPIQITELDIDGPTDQVQLDDYKRIFPIFWEHPSVTGITLWGYRPGHWRTAQGAFLALDNGAEKPALVWLKGYVRNNAPLITPNQVLSVSEKAINGTVIGQVQATDADTNTTFQNWQITGGSGASIFTVNASTGQITLVSDSVLNFETTRQYTLTLTVRDEYTGSLPTTVTIAVINVNEPPTAQLSAAPLEGFAPHPVTFNASASTDPDLNDVLTYTWNFGDGGTGTGATPIYTYNRPGIYQASVIVRDSSGLADTATVSITVKQGLKVQYKVRQNENKATDNHIRPFFQLVNIGDKAVPYSELTIRYWYTRENAVYPWAQDNTSQQFWCDYAALGTNLVKGKFVALPTPLEGADYYMEVSFTSAGLLAIGKNSGEIQTRFNNANWSNYNENGDYSYDPTKREYADWSRVTLYRNGQLIWGTEPGSAAIASARQARAQEPAFVTDAQLYPNPAAEGRFTLELPSFETSDKPVLRITTMEGKRILEQSLENRFFTNAQVLAPGMYILTVSTRAQVITKKLIVN